MSTNPSVVPPPPPTPPQPTDQATFYLFPSNSFELNSTDLRVQHVALQRWFNRRFFLREGFPCPVIFAGPMDAFAQFQNLWKQPNNPYNYLREMVEYNGLVPAPARVPLIAVDFKGMRYRPEQSMASRVNRRVGWPTVSDDVTLRDLGNVIQSRYPSAWTYTFQVDFFTARPDTRDFFIKQLMAGFKLASAGTPQTYIAALYPGYYGYAAQRMVLSSSIDDLTEKEPGEGAILYRMSFTLDIEGYAIDWSTVVTPTFWSLLGGIAVAIDPADLSRVYDEFNATMTEDLREGPVENPIILQRRDTLPPVT